MAGLSLNLETASDVLPLEPRPWGHEAVWAHQPEYAAKLLWVTAGKALSLQYHHTKAETMLCLSGDALLYLGRRLHRLRPGLSATIPAGSPHRLAALADTLVVEVSTAHLADVVRLVDDHGRESGDGQGPSRADRCQGSAEASRGGRNPTMPAEYKVRMSRDNRLATIAIMLATGQRLRAADLAQRFTVSERTVYRDMQRLADQGFPLAAIPGPNGGYAMFTTGAARNIHFELDEAVSLAIGAALASRVVCRDDGGAARRDLTKIQAALPDTISCALPDLLDLFEEPGNNGPVRHSKLI